MDNLNFHGEQFLKVYLKDYYLGNFTYDEIRLCLLECFDDIEEDDEKQDVEVALDFRDWEYL